MTKPLKIRLHAVSPLHVGCGEVYEPTSFAVDGTRCKLVEFNINDFMESITPDERKRFASICSQGTILSLVSIYKFISGRKVRGREVDIPKDFVAHHNQVLNLSQNEIMIKKELNTFAIARTAYNPFTELPYMPGTSVKGALRTGLLSVMAVERGISKQDRAKALENDLLGGTFSSDPFTLIKVSDFTPGADVKVKIMYAINRKKRDGEAGKGIIQIVEIVQPGSTFDGTVAIGKPIKRDLFKQVIEGSRLFKSAHDFYTGLYNKESAMLKGIGVETQTGKTLEDRFGSSLGKSAFLVRIGRHSGAEAVTIEGNRSIRIMPRKGEAARYLDRATTTWLASESRRPSLNSALRPFGWAVMELL